MSQDRTKRKKGVSLAKGPVALVGFALLAYGVSAFIFGGHSFAADPISGTVQGKTWLGLEVNSWSSLLFIGSGLLLLFGAPGHWSAKATSLFVGLVLGAAALIAAYDKQDVFGIFAANGPTKLAWGAAAVVLLVLALLPRVGAKTNETSVGERRAERDRSRRPDDDTSPVVERAPVRARSPRMSGETGSNSDHAPAAVTATGSARQRQLDGTGTDITTSRGHEHNAEA